MRRGIAPWNGGGACSWDCSFSVASPWSLSPFGNTGGRIALSTRCVWRAVSAGLLRADLGERMQQIARMHHRRARTPAGAGKGAPRSQLTVWIPQGPPGMRLPPLLVALGSGEYSEIPGNLPSSRSPCSARCTVTATARRCVVQPSPSQAATFERLGLQLPRRLRVPDIASV